MKYNDVLKELEKKVFRPVYIIDSPEILFREELFARLAAAFFENGEPNVRSFRAREKADYGELLTDIDTASLFSPRQIIKISECISFLEKNIRWLEEYLKAVPPSPDTVIYMEDDSSSLPKKEGTKNTLAALEKLHGRFDVLVVTPDLRRKNRVCSWLVSRASSVHGVSLGKKEAFLLMENTGTELKRLDMELEKLAMFVHPRKRISAEDIRELCTFNRENTIYEMLDALSAGDMEGALKYMENLLITGMHPLRILTALFYHIKKLLYARHLRSLGTPANEIISLTGVPPFFKEKFFGQVRAFPAEHLDAALFLIERADALSKGGTDARRTLERLVMILCLRHEEPKRMLQLL